jgi:ring-1,2-phenylacetyl-CoA epoxidase subunit PaaD
MEGVTAAEPETESVARPRPATPAARAVWDLVASVRDPEVPVLSIEDLGILREVAVQENGTVVVRVTPTYSGCPALDAIRADVVSLLAEHGYPDVEVETVLSPAWTTDWLSAEGRRKLEAYGIAPPAPARTGSIALGPVSIGPVSIGMGIRCPHCGSLHTREMSHFGSTACKAIYVCQRCREPFDYFKQH